MVALAVAACGQTSADQAGETAGDGGVLDSGLDVVVEVAPEADAEPPCIASGENASVTGTYPGGTFDAKYAIFWQASGECPTSLAILFAEAPAIVERQPETWPNPSLVIYVDDDVGVDPEMGFELYSDGGTVYDKGTAELFTQSYEPTGSFSIQTDTLTFSGTFAPNYCPKLDIFCP